MILYQKGGGADHPEYAAMSKVVTQRNKDNKWVKRRLDGNKLSIPDPDEEGKEMSHKLSMSEADGNFYVYPELVEEEGELVNLVDPKDEHAPFKYALKNNNAIRFNSAKFAEYYSKNGLIKH